MKQHKTLNPADVSAFRTQTQVSASAILRTLDLVVLLGWGFASCGFTLGCLMTYVNLVIWLHVEFLDLAENQKILLAV